MPGHGVMSGRPDRGHADRDPFAVHGLGRRQRGADSQPRRSPRPGDQVGVEVDHAATGGFPGLEVVEVPPRVDSFQIGTGGLDDDRALEIQPEFGGRVLDSGDRGQPPVRSLGVAGQCVGVHGRIGQQLETRAAAGRHRSSAS